MRAPRVAFFPDSFVEVNGVARTSAALEAFAGRRGFPFLTVHAGPRLEASRNAAGGRLQLPRSAVALHLERDLTCDLLFWRHARRVRRVLTAYRPDVIHITGPNDVGQLGAWLAWRLGVPLVGSWHTNVHEFAAERVARSLTLLPSAARRAVAARIERVVLDLAQLFYRIPRVLMAPNAELVALLERRTGRPTRLMRRGVDTEAYAPHYRTASDGLFRLGYVGRLSPEKSVRMLVEIERALLRRDAPPFRLVVVGDGSERPWLVSHLEQAELPGLLRGRELSNAYADMDAFVFPSATDTFGLVVLEALASGTPAIVRPYGGPKSIIEPGASGFVADTAAEFAECALRMMRDPARHRAMREAARRRALDWSWDRVFESVYEVYEEACADRPRVRARHGAAYA